MLERRFARGGNMKTRAEYMMLLGVCVACLFGCQNRKTDVEAAQSMNAITERPDNYEAKNISKKGLPFILVSEKYITSLKTTMNHYSAVEMAQEGKTPAIFAYYPENGNTIAIWNFHEGGEKIDQIIGEDETLIIKGQIYNKVNIDIENPRDISHYVAGLFLENATYSNEDINLNINDGIITINGKEYFLEFDTGAGYNKKHMNMLYHSEGKTDIGTYYAFSITEDEIALYEIKYEDSPVAVISDKPMILKKN
jgi:hypothetical protein